MSSKIATISVRQEPVATGNYRQRPATLRAIRTAKGLSLRAAAHRAKIDPAQLSRIERGRSGLSISALHRLAVVLDLEGLARELTPYVNEESL